MRAADAGRRARIWKLRIQMQRRQLAAVTARIAAAILRY
jgi:hypothetical protein